MLTRLPGAAATAAVLLSGLVLPAAPSSADDGPEPVRILIVGDSQTHGSVGDWTWRFRLWSNLAAQDVAVDFVGPHDGVLDRETEDHEDMRYADPAFDTDHAARWGMGFENLERPIGDLVEEYEPDVVVEMLGTVDLAFYQRSPEAVAASASELVDEVREVDPDVDVVLGHVFDRWVSGADQVNWWLDAIATDRDWPESRVVVARVPTEYHQNVDTYDPLHPSATGEVKIARSVATALAELEVGSQPDAFPLVVNGPPALPHLDVRERWGLVQLHWTMPDGATGVNLWRRIDDGAWQLVRTQRSSRAPGPGTQVQWRVQAYKWHAVSPFYSNTVTVRH